MALGSSVLEGCHRQSRLDGLSKEPWFSYLYSSATAKLTRTSPTGNAPLPSESSLVGPVSLCRTILLGGVEQTELLPFPRQGAEP